MITLLPILPVLQQRGGGINSAHGSDKRWSLGSQPACRRYGIPSLAHSTAHSYQWGFPLGSPHAQHPPAPRLSRACSLGVPHFLRLLGSPGLQDSGARLAALLLGSQWPDDVRHALNCLHHLRVPAGWRQGWVSWACLAARRVRQGRLSTAAHCNAGAVPHDPVAFSGTGAKMALQSAGPLLQGAATPLDLLTCFSRPALMRMAHQHSWPLPCSPAL